MKVRSAFCAAVVCLASVNSLASERVGVFSIEMIELRPTWRSEESDGSHFSLTDSNISFRWKLDKKLSATVSLGSQRERNLPIYYSAANDEQLGYYEAYAEYDAMYGRLRFGLLPLNFGYDGVLASSDRFFDRALPYEARAFGLRDTGFSFYTENKGYYTEVIGHNGEIDTEPDGRLWVTGRWGYTNERSFRTQLSLQTGYVEGVLSENSTNTLGGVVNDKTAQWRNGLLFAHWYPRDWNVVAQLGGGEVVQENHRGRFRSNLIEVTHYFSKNFGFGFRYDQFDPNRDVAGDAVARSSTAFIFKSKDSTSNVCFMYSKVAEEQRQVPNDEMRLFWLLTPYAR